jgi:hypothetical protein
MSFSISASDADGTIPALSADSLPSGASFADSGDGTGVFDWTPDFTQAGSYNVTFYAADDSSAVDSEVVTITVNDAGNQSPVLAFIGTRSTDENVNLSFTVTASDPDTTIPTLSADSLPLNANFVNNGDGSGSFDWTPDYTQSGTYNVIFIATDGSLSDSEVVTITVNEAGNQAPVLASIGSRSTTENINLNFIVTAGDPEGAFPSLTANGLPSGASFADSGDGTGVFDWTPDFTQADTYNVTFYATDDSAAVDSEVVLITINDAGNQTPVLAFIGSQTATEDVNMNFSISASDPDGTIPALTADSLPSGATFADSGDGIGVFDWTPDFTQAGSYNVTFYATDDSAAVDSEVVAITVNDAGNQTPVLAFIGARSTDENVPLSFTVSASDPDSTIPTLSADSLPLNANFVNNGDGTGSFDWTPDYTQSGTYDVIFITTDGSLSDSEEVTITVNEAGNQPPVLASIGSRSTTENINLNFIVTAGDPEGAFPILTASGLPSGATFADSGDGTGVFDWTPDFTQANTYNVTFYATDDSAAVDSEVVLITVNDAGNQTPVLAFIGPQTATEDVNLNFSISASDPDGTIPALTADSLPSGASFADSGDGTGVFDWTPDFTQAGSYNVTFYATDDSAAVDSEVVLITVSEAGNQAPVLAFIGARSATEDINLNFTVSASDPDTTTPGLSTSLLPRGAVFTDLDDGTGTFDWTPDFSQQGVYNVTFYASDGLLLDSEVVQITVIDGGNQTPVLAAIGNQIVTEGGSLNLSISATDADSTIPALTTSTLPPNAFFADSGDGTGVFSFNPGYTQSSIVSVIFYADDGLAVDSEQIFITIDEAGNQDPVLAAIGAQVVTEGQVLTVSVSASDPEAGPMTLTTSALPLNASFADTGDGTGEFTFSPDFIQSGIDTVIFYATDDSAAVDSEVVLITVIEAGNQLPVLALIGTQSTSENANLNFVISASDAEGVAPALTAVGLPVGALFADSGNGTGAFDWTPDFTQSGSYNVTFYATDDSLAVDSEAVLITVSEAGNQVPVLAFIGPRSTTENINLSFTVSASDPDSTIPTLSADSLPLGASFVNNGDGTGSFDWTPDFTQSGTYNVIFYAADDSSAVDSEMVLITVNEAGNQTPVLAPIGNQIVLEGGSLSLVISATDADSTIPVLTTSTLPPNASFADSGDGTGDFRFDPSYTQSGIISVTFYADDGLAVDSELIFITITEAGNQDPVLSAIGPQVVIEGQTLVVSISASDPEGNPPTLTSSAPPPNAGFVDSGGGTGDFTFSPDFTQAGPYSMTFYATDDSAAVDSEVVTITVNEAGNQSPVLASIGPRSTTENVPLSFSISASDPDSIIPSLTASGLPSGATFADSGDGTGSFDWTPDFTQAGTHDIIFYASDSFLVDSEVVTITVNDAGNQAPVLAAISDTSTTETVNLSFTVTATDPDTTIPNLSAFDLPVGATFADSGDGTGTFDWTPGFWQQGIYNMTFVATDGSLSDSQAVQITVIDAGNQVPVLAFIGPQSTDENVTLSFTVSASDPDSTIPVLSADSLPLNANFVNNGDGTGSFDWTPDYTQSGTYNVIFIATDGSLSDSEVVVVTVNEVNRVPVADAGPDQSNLPAGQQVQLDATGSFDLDNDPLSYSWVQVGGSAVTLSNSTDSIPTFTPTVVDVYLFELTIDDGTDLSLPDTVTLSVISGAPPVAVSDLSIQIVGDAIALGWSGITLDTTGLPTTVDRYVVYRGTSAYFTPTPTDSIGVTDSATLSFTDNDINGANVVGDTAVQYFYVVQVVDFLENRSVLSNRVGEYDYQLVTTATTDYNLVGIPFTNTGIADADGLINAIGSSNVLTVNSYVPASQSFQSRFAAGFGVNFSVVAGGVYQINAAADTIFSVAGNIPDSGTISYSIITTATTSFNFLMIPFEREADFSVAQDVIDNIPGVLNTLNNFVAGSQSYESRFAAGFGSNFSVRAGKPYQANAAATGTFPGP